LPIIPQNSFSEKAGLVTIGFHFGRLDKSSRCSAIEDRRGPPGLLLMRARAF